MDSESYVARLDELESWLKGEGDCNPATISARFGTNEKTARNYINRLRNRGLNIIYSKKAKKYVLET